MYFYNKYFKHNIKKRIIDIEIYTINKYVIVDRSRIGKIIYINKQFNIETTYKIKYGDILLGEEEDNITESRLIIKPLSIKNNRYKILLSGTVILIKKNNKFEKSIIIQIEDNPIMECYSVHCPWKINNNIEYVYRINIITILK